MSNLEFLGQIKPKRLTSLEEDYKRSQEEFRKDELNRALRHSGKLKQEPLETIYERFSQKKVKPTLESLLAEGQLISGRNVIEQNKLKEKELELFQQALEFEERHRKPRGN